MNQFTPYTKKLNTFEFLSKLGIFKSLAAEQLHEIVKLIEVRQYQKNAIIFHEGQKAHYSYIIYSGMVKIHKYSDDGKEYILQTLTDGGMFAEVPMFAGDTYPANSTALEDSILLAFSRENLLRLVAREPQVALNLLAIQAKRLREFTLQIEELTLKDSLSRLINYLLKHADKDKIIHNKLSITNLAKLLNMTRENLSKLLGRLVQEGAIVLEKNRIILRKLM
ncbi:MAG: Crp/Fnr family transcriptional regulator [Gammaproteobacteria bacterium]|nr:Crp/Fnr family transcriptional regulator [Gammaproteobacteria bacterium]